MSPRTSSSLVQRTYRGIALKDLLRAVPMMNVLKEGDIKVGRGQKGVTLEVQSPLSCIESSVPIFKHGLTCEWKTSLTKHIKPLQTFAFLTP